MRCHLYDLAQSFQRALQLLFFRPVARYTADPSRAVLGVLIVLALATTALMEAVAGAADFEFNITGLLWLCAGWATFLGLLWLLRPARARFGFGRLVADYTAIGILTGLVWAAAMALGTAVEPVNPLGVSVSGWSAFAFGWLLFIWWIAAAWRAGHVTWTGSDWRFGGRAAVLGFLLPFLLPATPMISGRDTPVAPLDLWTIAGIYWSAYTGTDTTGLDDEKPVDVEAVYYRQPSLVASALANLKPSDPKRTEIYFLGAAGFAHQDVFRSEVTKTRDLFDERFDTTGRSVVVMNHRDTVSDVPLANATNLDALLAGLALKMDTQNDVLALFLTSHGSPGTFQIQFSGFSFNDLTPERLADMLNRSGIKNRVLVISACYSGSFISALKNENTLIVTAASAERSSFGCSNEREWTYFGEAYFNQALRGTHSFEAGFETAKQTISGWEKAQKLTPSDPQISMGNAIRPRLQALARDLAAQPPRQPNQPLDPHAATPIGVRAEADAPRH